MVMVMVMWLACDTWLDISGVMIIMYMVIRTECILILWVN